MTTTTNLSEFGNRERAIAIELMTEWNKGNLPSDFEEENIQIMMNTSSGNVFLTNEYYKVAMINNESGKIESFYSSPYNGIEGFYGDLVDQYESMHEEDKKWFDDLPKKQGIR
ncbi:MAG TPA: hypothetical protein DEG69_10905 [Flavobacteriaceae bacterium]|nr:hypothetical protein [Flavobacteriaceae bacterium]